MNFQSLVFDLCDYRRKNTGEPYRDKNGEFEIARRGASYDFPNGYGVRVTHSVGSTEYQLMVTEREHTIIAEQLRGDDDVLLDAYKTTVKEARHTVWANPFPNVRLTKLTEEEVTDLMDCIAALNSIVPNLKQD